MTYKIQLSPLATRNIRAAANWWREKRPKAPRAFRQDLAHALRLVSEHPDVGTPVAKTHLRRILVRRIRYWVYYRVYDDYLEIVALWHVSREGSPDQA